MLKRKERNCVPREGAQAAVATFFSPSLDGRHCPCAAGSSGRPDGGGGGCRKGGSEGDKGSGSSSGGGAAGAGGGSRGAPPPGAAAGGALRGDGRPRSGEEYFISLTCSLQGCNLHPDAANAAQPPGAAARGSLHGAGRPHTGEFFFLRCCDVGRMRWSARGYHLRWTWHPLVKIASPGPCAC